MKKYTYFILLLALVGQGCEVESAPVEKPAKTVKPSSPAPTAPEEHVDLPIVEVKPQGVSLGDVAKVAVPGAGVLGVLTLLWFKGKSIWNWIAAGSASNKPVKTTTTTQTTHPKPKQVSHTQISEEQKRTMELFQDLEKEKDKPNTVKEFEKLIKTDKQNQFIGILEEKKEFLKDTLFTKKGFLSDKDLSKEPIYGQLIKAAQVGNAGYLKYLLQITSEVVSQNSFSLDKKFFGIIGSEDAGYDFSSESSPFYIFIKQHCDQIDKEMYDLFLKISKHADNLLAVYTQEKNQDPQYVFKNLVDDKCNDTQKKMFDGYFEKVPQNSIQVY